MERKILLTDVYFYLFILFNLYPAYLVAVDYSRRLTTEIKYYKNKTANYKTIKGKKTIREKNIKSLVTGDLSLLDLKRWANWSVQFLPTLLSVLFSLI